MARLEQVLPAAVGLAFGMADQGTVLGYVFGCVRFVSKLLYGRHVTERHVVLSCRIC